MTVSDVPTLLNVEDLSVAFGHGSQERLAIAGVSFRVTPGRIVALVGESASGKTTTAFAVVGLLPGTGHVTGGRVLFRGEDLLHADEARLRRLRGDRIGMIFQNPMHALNPALRVEKQITEVICAHRSVSRSDARRLALEILSDVRIGDPKRVARMYPHELSGGMRQRVVIAIAVVLEPDLLIADEPTTALDATIESEIVAVLRELQQRRSMGVLFITHNLALAASISDDVVVMYAGEVVETGPAGQVFGDARHPYSAGLLASLPRGHWRRARVVGIAGQVAAARLEGCCQFSNRCPKVMPRCQVEVPQLSPLVGQRTVRCFLYGGAGCEVGSTEEAVAEGSGSLRGHTPGAEGAS